MAEQQSPTVEVAAPTVIISNSSEGGENGLVNDTGETSGEPTGEGGEPIAGEPNGTGELSSHNSGSAEDDTPPVVAIAEIEAERDITLAAIHDETERERLRLEAERIDAIEEGNKEYIECQREIQELREQVQRLTDLLIPPPPLEETVTEEQLETVPETSLTQPSTVAPTAETLTEPLEESVEESPEPEAPSPGRKYIAI